MTFKALLVHDDAAAPEVLTAAVATADCAVGWTARSCDEAHELFVGERSTSAPDVIVVDVAGMPHDDVALRRLAKRLREVPMIVVTDAAALDDVDVSVADVVLRPVRSAELAARIRAGLRLHAERKRRGAREKSLLEKVQKLERENHDLGRMVCADSLTGVANRRHVFSLLHAEWKRALRDHTQLSLVLLDVDYFHAYNERYGHPGGDTCLRRLSESLASCLRRPSDFVGRYGGEEFLVVLANTDATGARIVGERLRRTIEALGIPHESSPFGAVTISVGFATVRPTPDITVETLVSEADEALFRAKANGRNRTEGEAPAASPTATFNPWWTRFPIVVIDPWLADRVPRFLDEARADVHAVHVARRARNAEQLRTLAKKVMGAARDYGFDQLHDLAAELESASRAEDRERVRRAAVELERYLTYVQVVYRRAPESRSA